MITNSIVIEDQNGPEGDGRGSMVRPFWMSEEVKRTR